MLPLLLLTLGLGVALAAYEISPKARSRINDYARALRDAHESHIAADQHLENATRARDVAAQHAGAAIDSIQQPHHLRHLHRPHPHPHRCRSLRSLHHPRHLRHHPDRLLRRRHRPLHLRRLSLRPYRLLRPSRLWRMHMQVPRQSRRTPVSITR